MANPTPSLPPPSSIDDLLTLYDLSIDPKTNQVSLSSPAPSGVAKDLDSVLSTINELSSFLIRGPFPHCPPPGPPPPPPTSPPNALPPNPRAVQINRLKNDGNLFFNKSEFPRAVEAYTRAAELALSRPLFENHNWVKEELAILLCNRCAAYSGMRRWDEALKDAEAVVELKANWSKGHFRKVKVLCGMGRWEDALDACLHGLEWEPDNKELVALAEEAKEGLRKSIPEGKPVPLSALRPRQPVPPPAQPSSTTVVGGKDGEGDQKARAESPAASSSVVTASSPRPTPSTSRASTADPEDLPVPTSDPSPASASASASGTTGGKKKVPMKPPGAAGSGGGGGGGKGKKKKGGPRK